MTEEYRAKVFKSGNSVALRLPKALGLKEGEEMRILREDRSGFKIEPVEQPRRKIDLTGLYGACPGLKLRTPDERVIEARDLDWDGKLIRGD